MTDGWPGRLHRLIQDQIQAIGLVLDVIHKQKEALKEGRLELLDGLTRELDKAQRQAMVCESLRSTLADKIAAEEGCEATLGALAAMAPSNQEELKSAGAELRRIVVKARDEVVMLGALVDESRALGDITINEWKRLGGASLSSGLDLKG